MGGGACVSGGEPCVSDEECDDSLCVGGFCEAAEGVDSGANPDGGGSEDAGGSDDAGLGPRLDGGPEDAGATDAGLEDSGRPDAGGTDAGGLDAGIADAGPDGGALDAGPHDGGTADGGPDDAGAADAGLFDGGPGHDAGQPCIDGDGDGAGEGCLLADCDDADPARSFGRNEICDGIDNDCNDVADDGSVCGCPLVWRPGQDDQPVAVCATRVWWADALSFCDAMPHYRLAVIEDPVEQAFLASMASMHPRNDFWIGLDDLEQQGSYDWVDGTPLTYQSWTPGEPNQAGERCVVTRPVGWHDEGCNSWRPWFCEADVGLREDNLVACELNDIDDDGYGEGCARGPDCAEGDTSRFALQSLYADADGDGLSEAMPTTFCTAGELVEAAPATVPADCNDAVANQGGCPSDCTTLVRNDRAYSFCRSNKTWSDADTACQNEYAGARLVVLETEAENDLIRELGAIAGVNDPWLGLSDSANENNFVWLGGGSPTFLNWAPDEPNDGEGAGEDCVVFDQLGWDDRNCGDARDYVCERAFP